MDNSIILNKEDVFATCYYEMTGESCLDISEHALVYVACGSMEVLVDNTPQTTIKDIESAVHLPIYETAWNYRGPVYIMQGAHDPIVPFTYAELYNHGYSNSQLNIIPNVW